MSESLLTIDLGTNGGKFDFKTKVDIENWLNHEKQFWAWLDNESYFNGDNELRTNIRNLRNLARQKQQEFLNILGQNEPNYTELKTPLESFFKMDNVLHSSTPKAKFIETLRLQKPTVAICALAHLAKWPLDTKYTGATEGTCKAILYQYGLIEESANGVKEEIDIMLSKSKDSLYNFMDSGRKAYEDLKNEHDEKLKNLANTYKEKLKLLAPVEYWEMKQQKHRYLAKWFGWTSLLVLILSGVVTFCVTKTILPKRPPQTRQNIGRWVYW